MIGGAVVTEEFQPNFHNSSCSYVVIMLQACFANTSTPNLPDGKMWNDKHDAAAYCVIKTMTEFASNFKASILGQRILSLLDLEREYSLVAVILFTARFILIKCRQCA